MAMCFLPEGVGQKLVAEGCLSGSLNCRSWMVKVKRTKLVGYDWVIVVPPRHG